MKFLIQRVKHASVTIDGIVKGEIDKGFAVLIGVNNEDDRSTADKMIKKLTNMRIFMDENGKTNLSLSDVSGSLLLVSQFTLYAVCKKGNRPSFVKAGDPVHAEEMYDYIVEKCREWAISTENPEIKIETGSFGAEMMVSIENDGPFTVDLDSTEL